MVRLLCFFLFSSGCIALPDPAAEDASVRDSDVTDAAVDSGRDASRPDARSDASRDSAMDAAVRDAALDVPSEAAVDAALDAGAIDAALDASTPPPILIAELRTRGPAGGNDEFVEIVNVSEHAIDISGFKLRAASTTGVVTTRAVVPAGVMLAPGGYFLFANSGASGYSGAALPDVTYAFGLGDACGIAITDAEGNAIDAFSTIAGSPFTEGNPREPLVESIDQAHARRTHEGAAIDTDDNASDFVTARPSTPRSQKGEVPQAQ